jgi:WD40 repeat protein
VRTFAGEFRRVTFSVDGTQFIGSSFDGGIHVFDLNTGAEMYDLRGSHYNPDVALSSDPRILLLAASADAIIFDLGQQSEIEVSMGGLGERLESWGFNGHHSAVSTGGGLIYVPFFDADGTGYRIFDLSDGTLLREATDVWRVAAMTHDGAYVAEIPRLETNVIDPDGETAELFGPIQIVDTRTGEVVVVFDSTCGFYAASRWDPTLPRHEDCREDQLHLPLSDAEFSADGVRLGADSWAGTPAVFDTGTGELLWHTVLDRDVAFEHEAGAVGLSPDGQTFIYRSGGILEDWTFTAVDVGSGRTIGEAEQYNPNYEIVYSADGSRFYAANWAGSVGVYDGETFELLDRLTRGQGGGVLDVAVRGNLVANATFDKVVRVQTLDTHELLLEINLPVKAENVEWIDDTHLLVITLSDVAFIFTMDGEELMQIATQRLTRGFTAEECASFNIDPCPTLDEIRNG